MQYREASDIEESEMLQVMVNECTAPPLDNAPVEDKLLHNTEDGDERDAHILKKRIVDDILSLKCPRCRQVCIDFGPGLTLGCCNNSCGAAFCGWCLKDCGEDAHPHVIECPAGAGMHALFGVFEEHHRLRRQKAVQRIFDDQHVPQVRRILFNILVVELTDLNITITNTCNAAFRDAFAYPCNENEFEALKCIRISTLRETRNPRKPDVEYARLLSGHDVTDLCYLGRSIGDSLPVAFPLRVDLGEAVIIAGAAYYPSVDVISSCMAAVTYRPACGHDRSGVACADAFAWAHGRIPFPRCEELVTRQSPVCGHSIELPCWSNDLLLKWWPWHDNVGKLEKKEGGEEVKPIAEADMGADELPDFKVLSHCDQNGQTVDVISVAHDHREPSKAPVPHEMLVCDSSAMLLRECGHSESLPCVQALYKTIGPCKASHDAVCNREYCGAVYSYKCCGLSAAKSIMTKRCEKTVSKLCTICSVNKVSVKCSKDLVECRRIVKADLECKHEISWACGLNPDPRLDPPGTLNCAKCVVPHWRSAIDAEAPAYCFGMKQASMVKTMLFLSKTFVLECHDLPLPNWYYKGHLKSRQRILKVYADILERGNVEKLTLPPSGPGSASDIDNYDVVYQSTASNDFKPYEKTDTEYGLGYLLLPLTFENLRREKPDCNGLLRICIGLAYKHQCLEGTLGFRKPDRQDNLHMATLQSQLRMSCGFDSVDVYSSDRAEAKDTEKARTLPDSRVYWYDYIALPLCVVSLKLHIQCMLCFDYYSAGEGICCSKGHLVCREGCFGGYVDSCGKPDAMGSLVDTSGWVKCPHPKCTDVYTAQLMIDNKADAAATEALEMLRTMAHGYKEAAAAKAKLLEEIRLEDERIQNIQDGDKREAHILKKRIVNDILCLKCPRCRAVFSDFDGCFALTCHCRAAFCGWCLMDCGNDALNHVLRCPEGQGIFSPFSVFEEHHRVRRQKKVQGVLDDQDSHRVRQLLVNILTKELVDLKIKVVRR